MQTKHLCVLINIWTKGEVETSLSPPVKYFTDRFKVDFFCGSLMLFLSCVSHSFASIHCCLVVTCWERADLLALVCDVQLCARLFICALWSPAGKGLTSWLSFVVSSVSLSLSHWYPGSGVVLDCIDS